MRVKSSLKHPMLLVWQIWTLHFKMPESNQKPWGKLWWGIRRRYKSWRMNFLYDECNSRSGVLEWRKIYPSKDWGKFPSRWRLVLRQWCEQPHDRQLLLLSKLNKNITERVRFGDGSCGSIKGKGSIYSKAKMESKNWWNISITFHPFLVM